MTTELAAAPDRSGIRALTIDEIEDVSGGYSFWWVLFITPPLMIR
jgi:hypothetical protein